MTSSVIASLVRSATAAASAASTTNVVNDHDDDFVAMEGDIASVIERTRQAFGRPRGSSSLTDDGR